MQICAPNTRGKGRRVQLLYQRRRWITSSGIQTPTQVSGRCELTSYCSEPYPASVCVVYEASESDAGTVRSHVVNNSWRMKCPNCNMTATIAVFVILNLLLVGKICNVFDSVAYTQYKKCSVCMCACMRGHVTCICMPQTKQQYEVPGSKVQGLASLIVFRFWVVCICDASVWGAEIETQQQCLPWGNHIHTKYGFNTYNAVQYVMMLLYI